MVASWIFIAMLAPILFALSTFIDKFVLSRYFKSSSNALVAYSGLIAIPAIILIYLFNPKVININSSTALLIVLNSFLYIGYFFPYYAAIKRADASSVIPLFQMIPIFNLVLAFLILHEKLSLIQLGAFFLIIIGALTLSLDFKKKFSLRKDVIYFMLFASFIVALNITLFKFFAISTDFWTTSFWQYLGFLIFSIILLLIFKKTRKQFLDSFSENKIPIISLNIFNEIINLGGVIISSYAILLAPIALVSSINGLVPVFVFIIGLVLSFFFPKIIKEDTTRFTIIKKIVALALIFIGGYILNSAV